jgi:hypothetical protein
MSGARKQTRFLRDNELLAKLKLCQIMIPAIQKAKTKVKGK